MKPKTLIHSLLFGLVLLACACFSDAQTVVPLGGLGAVQVFDNNGNECTACVLYTYQAGTVTQQATYTDYTATTQNTNPITFGSGGRSNVWLTSGAYYKFVLCLQNDGAYCAPADVLFSVDQVLAGGGGSGGGGGGSSPYTGTFISGSANPATSGILELASGDSICWRNAAGTSNFCLSKDTSDVLAWGSGTLKLPMNTCSSTSVGYGYLCASSTNGRLFQSANGGSYAQLVQATGDINASDQVTQLHFGGTPIPLCATPPGTNNYLFWNGSCVTGQILVTPEMSFGTSNLQGITGICGSYSYNNTCAYTQLSLPHTITRIVVVMEMVPIGCSTNAIVGVKDITAGTVLMSLSPTTVGLFTNTGSVVIPAGHVMGVGVLTAPVGCSQFPYFGSVNAVYQ